MHALGPFNTKAGMNYVQGANGLLVRSHGTDTHSLGRGKMQQLLTGGLGPTNVSKVFHWQQAEAQRCLIPHSHYKADQHLQGARTAMTRPALRVAASASGSARK